MNKSASPVPYSGQPRCSPPLHYLLSRALPLSQKDDQGVDRPLQCCWYPILYNSAQIQSMWDHSISALYSKPRHRSIVLNDFCLLFHGIYRFCFDSFIQCCEDYASCIHCITNGMGLIHCLKKPISISLIHRITTSSVATLYSSRPFRSQVLYGDS